MKPVNDPPVPQSHMLIKWQRAGRGQAALQPMYPRRFRDFERPCAGCQAWCCTRLSFPHSTPANVGNLDHLKFCLGFPGVEVGIDEGDNYTIIVRTRCRHRVDDNGAELRCGVFDSSERPQICALYDASLCGYKFQHGRPRPDRFLRVQLSEFQDMVELFQFDENGYVLYRPNYEAIRQRIEARWSVEGPLIDGAS